MLFITGDNLMKMYRLSFGGRFSNAFLPPIFCSILSFSILLCGNSAFSQTGKASSVSGQSLTIANLETDARMKRRIDIAREDGRLDDLLAKLTDQSKVRLMITKHLSTRKISCSFQGRSLVTFMSSLTRVLDVSWRSYGDGYLLFQTDGQIARENRLKRESEAREASFIQAQRQALKNEITAAMQAPESSRSLMATFLLGCDPASLEFGYSSAIEDEAFISATDQSHFLNHFCNVKPYSSLIPSQQQAVSEIALKTGYAGLSGSSMVGLIAAAGGFRLGIASSSDRDLWVAPGLSIGHAAVMSDQVRENDFDPAIEAFLATERAIDLHALSTAKRKLIVPPEKLSGINSLSRLLTNVSGVGGFNFLSDSSLNSGTSYYPLQSFQPGKSYTVDQALRAIGRGFAHRMAFRDGSLMVGTLTSGLDLRLEPPTPVMNFLDAQTTSGKLPDVADFLAMTECTRSQLALLALRHPARYKINAVCVVQAYRHFPFLQFYHSLNPSQRVKALSEDGLSGLSMTATQRIGYASLISSQTKRKSVALRNPQKYRFYVGSYSFQPKGFPKRIGLRFALTDPNDARWCCIGLL